MGLNHHAQKVVDDKIAELWAAFKAGSASAGEESPSRVDFKLHVEATEPNLAGYIEQEKLV